MNNILEVKKVNKRLALAQLAEYYIKIILIQLDILCHWFLFIYNIFVSSTGIIVGTEETKMGILIWEPAGIELHIYIIMMSLHLTEQWNAKPAY